MIITLAGRRIDALDAEITRFPVAHSSLVRTRIQQVLQEQGATMLVSAAACGSDLLALDAAGELGIRRHIILPFSPARFRSSSVVDRPGTWGKLFDRVIAEVTVLEDLLVLHRAIEDKDTFLYTNKIILDEAQKLARQACQQRERTAANAVCAVVVWEGRSRGEEDITANFAHEAQSRGIPVIEIMTH
jgi:hypothetical protein